MDKQQGIEEIKRHLEAIMEVVKKLGTDDYLNLSVMNDESGEYMSFSNDYTKSHRHDGKAMSFSSRNGEWRDWTEMYLEFLEKEDEKEQEND